MQRSDFFYELPRELIAQHHAVPRDSSRLMVLSRHTGAVEDRVFSDLTEYLHEGDVLVVNDSKVIPARLFGKKPTGGEAEILLLRCVGGNRWECLAKPGKRLKTGAVIDFSDELSGTIADELPDGNRIIELDIKSGESFFEVLDRVGHMPLPHYITEPLKDNSMYQTVYAGERGSAAAPTAGLHFTEELLDRLRLMGVDIAKITLHVGLGTFRPVKEDDITQHVMHREFFTVGEDAAERINDCKKSGGRVIAVGTTSCRTLEATAQSCGRVTACSDSTDIFIYPGYEFKVIDGLITNFHLPESTLIMLVSAFAGYENTMNAYRLAVERRYRFFSFGDAMLIV